MKKKILFIDRDGTIIREPAVDFQVDRLEKVEFLPGVIGGLREMASRTDYELVMVSNQDGLGTSSFPYEDFIQPHQWMLKTLAGEGVVFSDILIDKSFPEECSPFRKPATGLVEKYMNDYLDRENSYVIGDRITDMQLARNMGIRGIYLGNGETPDLPVALHSNSWREVVAFLLNGSRKIALRRQTAETDIRIELDLNGSGQSRISTGMGFFDHMLEQIARHGGIDLTVKAAGDLTVDEHHTVEDTALVLGMCFNEALGSRKGLERYGFVLPMDEAEAKVLIDFGGRSGLKWKADFNREYVGDLPTEMIPHFFTSFCQEARCSLHIEALGENTHHLIEAIFKAFGRSIKQAVKQSGTLIPSSKGLL